MTTTVPASPATNQRRKVAVATMIGSTIEWYDFFIYATAASLVFAGLFFQPAGDQFAILLSFASMGISFFFRPLGAFLAGHFGDKIGRRQMLVLTLILMGASTTLIGILPTYSAIGIAAPILLLLLRILQGISAGGEWGGAALMAVEHAETKKRGIMGAFPQMGVPLGLLLASGINGIMLAVAPGEAFLEWGWRIPFILSIVLVFVGYFVRRSVEESPVFTEMAEKKQQQKAPVTTLFKKHPLLLVLAALVFAGNSAAGYLTTGGFVTNYVTNPEFGFNIDRAAIVNVITFAGLFWLISTIAGGFLADKLGRKRTTVIAFIVQLLCIVPFFWLISSGNLMFITLATCAWYFVNGFSYGPQAAWYSELFPASVRFTGASLAYAFGAVIGGAFAPMISTALTQSFGINAVAIYMAVITAVALVAALLLRDRQGIDLSADNEEEQSRGTTVFDRPGVD